jgi:hypothetical protein
VDGLINAVALALAIRDTAQAGAGQQTDASGDDRSLVADDVAEQVARNHNTVETPGVLDHDHSSAVDQLVAELQLGKLLLENLGDHLAPQTARS